MLFVAACGPYRFALTGWQYSANNRRRKDAFRIPLADRELLSKLGWQDKLADVDKCIAANVAFVRDIVAQTQIFGEAGDEVSAPDEEDDDGDEQDGEPGVLMA